MPNNSSPKKGDASGSGFTFMTKEEMSNNKLRASQEEHGSKQPESGRSSNSGQQQHPTRPQPHSAGARSSVTNNGSSSLSALVGSENVSYGGWGSAARGPKVKKSVDAHASRYHNTTSSNASNTSRTSLRESFFSSTGRIVSSEGPTTTQPQKPSSAPDSHQARYNDGDDDDDMQSLVSQGSSVTGSKAGGGGGGGRFKSNLLLDVLVARRTADSSTSSPDSTPAKGSKPKHQGQSETTRSGRASVASTTASQSSMAIQKRLQQLQQHQSKLRTKDAMNLTARSVDTVGGQSIASTALSVSSLAMLERALGKELPLTDGATSVTLTKSDVSKIKDPSTLKFLEENADLFADYFAAQRKQLQQQEETEQGADTLEKPESGGNAIVEESHSLEEQATAPKASINDLIENLQEEIDTFITAVDAEGASYNIKAINDEGELVIPIAATAEGGVVLGGDDANNALLQELEGLMGGLDGVDLQDGENDVGDMTAFDAEDLAAFDREFNLTGGDDTVVVDGDVGASENDAVMVSDGIEEDGVSPGSPADDQPEGQGVTSNDSSMVRYDGDSLCSTAKDGTVSDPELEPGKTIDNKQQQDGGPMPTSLVGHGAEQRRQMVLRQASKKTAKNGDQQPHYMSSTKKLNRQAATANQSGLEPSPPRGGDGAGEQPGPSAKANIFNTTYVSRLTKDKMGGGKDAEGKTNAPAVVVKASRSKLSETEERRVSYILDHDDWEDSVQQDILAVEAEEAKRKKELEKQKRREERAAKGEDGGPSSDDDETSSQKPASTIAASSTTSKNHAYAYNEDSTASYMPSKGGYALHGELAERMETIEERLAKFEECRARAGTSSTAADGAQQRLSLNLSAATTAKQPSPSPTSSRPPTALSNIDESLMLLEAPGATPRSQAGSTTGGGDGIPPHLRLKQRKPQVSKKPAVDQTNKPSPRKPLVSAGDTFVSTEPTTKEAEEQRLAAAKRKKLGDGYVQEMREEQQKRQQLNKINDALGQLSKQVDVLHTPPFSFAMQYNAHLDPTEMQWPEISGGSSGGDGGGGAPPMTMAPTEGDIAFLLSQAEEEQQQEKELNGLQIEEKKKKTESNDADDVVEEDIAIADGNNGVVATTSENNNSTAFVEIMRSRLDRAKTILHDLKKNEKPPSSKSAAARAKKKNAADDLVVADEDEKDADEHFSPTSSDDDDDIDDLDLDIPDLPPGRSVAQIMAEAEEAHNKNQKHDAEPPTTIDDE